MLHRVRVARWSIAPVRSAATVRGMQPSRTVYEWFLARVDVLRALPEDELASHLTSGEALWLPVQSQEAESSGD
jgi:hypothetical protein